MIYLDYNASTPMDPRVAKLVSEASRIYANPSSTHHQPGQQAAELVERARSRIANLVSRPCRDVVLTSGASEAASIAIVGAMVQSPARPNAVVAATEHKAIITAAETGARISGGEVRVAPVERSGLVDIGRLSELVDDSISIVAVMAANNETGVLGPIEAASEITHAKGALLFSDVTQLIGKSDASNVASWADLMVCSSHKLYGPKGAGALIASRHTQKLIVPIMGGGGQEYGLRGGTSNTAALAGFGLAAELAGKEQTDDSERLRLLRDLLLNGLRHRLGPVEVNGGEVPRICNTLNVRIPGADADAVMASQPDVAMSSGSACQSAVPTPSHVLLAMGLTSTEASESIRISLGRPTTEAEILQAVEKISVAAIRVRELTSTSKG